MAIGQEVAISGESLSIYLDHIVSDSRCPTGAECFWAGEVSLRVDITFLGEIANLTFTESGASATTATQDYNRYRITYHVTPYPQVNETIESKDYRLRVTVTLIS
jgi:hypothetical protein